MGKILSVLIIVALIACTGSRKLQNQIALDAASVKSMVDNKDFIFVAESVSPMSGRRRELSSGYQISISKDSIISHLPFFGRGYTAPISPADVDFDFTATKFTYTAAAASKGWTISIKPVDQNYLQELYFRIFDNGSAYLNITSINRSSIAYNGYITERKVEAKSNQIK